MIYLWSDLHIGHANLADKWRPAGGGTVPLHNAWLKRVWNQVVTPDDEVWIVGDACMGNLEESLAFMATFNGTKHLIPGNHDRVHPEYQRKHGVSEDKVAKWQAMYEQVFILEPPTVYGGVIGLPENVILNHFPWSVVVRVREGEDDSETIRTYGLDRDFYRDAVLIHGHTHSTHIVGDHMIHVGVDAMPDGPVSIPEIKFLLTYKEKDGWK